jgi:hypothetical protein
MKKGLSLQHFRRGHLVHGLKRGELSSVGSEHLPYKQRVDGSNPSVPTPEIQIVTFVIYLDFFVGLNNRIIDFLKFIGIACKMII